jgi:hypothetical protein
MAGSIAVQRRHGEREQPAGEQLQLRARTRFPARHHQCPRGVVKAIAALRLRISAPSMREHASPIAHPVQMIQDRPGNRTGNDLHATTAVLIVSAAAAQPREASQSATFLSAAPVAEVNGTEDQKTP